MSLLTSVNGIPYPENTDATNFPFAFQGVADAVDTVMVPRFANAAARDAAITAPIAGQMCFIQKSSGAYDLQVYRAGAWADMVWGSIVPKTIAETRTSTITPTSDGQLLFFAQANSTYIMECMLGFSHATSSTINALVRAFAPAGSTASGTGIFTGPNPTGRLNLSQTFISISDSLTTSFTVGSMAGVTQASRGEYKFKIVTGGTAGNVGLQWAQGVSDPGATSLATGSYIRYYKIA